MEPLAPDLADLRAKLDAKRDLLCADMIDNPARRDRELADARRLIRFYEDEIVRVEGVL